MKTGNNRVCVQIGDVVRISDWKGSQPDTREHGTIVRVEGSHRWSQARAPQRLAEVLWQNGIMGWVLTSRLSKIEKAS